MPSQRHFALQKLWDRRLRQTREPATVHAAVLRLRRAGGTVWRAGSQHKVFAPIGGRARLLSTAEIIVLAGPVS